MRIEDTYLEVLDAFCTERFRHEYLRASMIDDHNILNRVTYNRSSYKYTLYKKTDISGILEIVKRGKKQ